MGEGKRSAGLGGDWDRTIDGNRLVAKERDRQDERERESVGQRR